MPLSEKLRLQAGRPFIHTLIARILVCLVLLIATFVICGKIQSQYTYKGNVGLNNKSTIYSYETVVS
jgi:hypothetical protein